MKFSAKIFISVFITIFILGSTLIWAAHRYVSHQARAEYISRYTVFSTVLGDTLSHLDTQVESLMKNAARVVADHDATDGVLSTGALKQLRDELSVTHIFVTDKSGKFIRSTNEDPSLIPNAYNFCDDYRKLTAGTSDVESTPIIHPKPEPKPYKFMFIPSNDRQRLLEVGVRVDFIAKTLTQAIGADPNLVSMSLYSPIGEVFGRFNSKNVEFKDGQAVKLPAEFPTLNEDDDTFRFFTKVESSHPHCCQCEVSGTSRNGEYYYVLESEISKSGLKVIQASMDKTFLWLAVANLLLAIFLSRFIARRLVRNILKAVDRVRAIKTDVSLSKRIQLRGDDEVTYLTDEFDHLLDSLEESEKKIIEAEKLRAEVDLAHEVAHNIKSPAIAIEMMMPMLFQLPEKLRNVLRDSAKDIKTLAERMNRLTESSTGGPMPPPSVLIPVDLSKLVNAVVNEKQIEFAERKTTVIFAKTEMSSDVPLAAVDSTEFRVVLSNIINNAAQAYSDGGVVRVSCNIENSSCVITVRDSGRGISADVLSKLGSRGATFNKPGGKGIGLAHAFSTIRSWGGDLHIESKLGAGSTVTIRLPVAHLQPIKTESAAHAELEMR